MEALGGKAATESTMDVWREAGLAGMDAMRNRAQALRDDATAAIAKKRIPFGQLSHNKQADGAERPASGKPVAAKATTLQRPPAPPAEPSPVTVPPPAPAAEYVGLMSPSVLSPTYLAFLSPNRAAAAVAKAAPPATDATGPTEAAAPATVVSTPAPAAGPVVLAWSAQGIATPMSPAATPSRRARSKPARGSSALASLVLIAAGVWIGVELATTPIRQIPRWPARSLTPPPALHRASPPSPASLVAIDAAAGSPASAKPAAHWPNWHKAGGSMRHRLHPRVGQTAGATAEALVAPAVPARAVPSPYYEAMSTLTAYIGCLGTCVVPAAPIPPPARRTLAGKVGAKVRRKVDEGRKAFLGRIDAGESALLAGVGIFLTTVPHVLSPAARLRLLVAAFACVLF